ncbi:hypothetical protein ACEZ3G_05405 [Maribacter algicola]|uniref:Uncharacterized protein n=1 Tax=Meishania litoralis TaxID=3434685 RepID=A0ACC7LI45_9FLAO
MKTKLVLMLSIICLTSACEDALNLGKTDCYWSVKNDLDELEDEFQYEMTVYKDEDGNVESNKVCKWRKATTYAYWYELNFYRTGDYRGCDLTEEEMTELGARIDKRRMELDQDREVYTCED